MAFETILLEKKDGVGTLFLNRPDVMNAIDNTMRRELLVALEEIELDKDVRVLILTGKGKAFSAGGDIRAMGTAERMIRPHPIILKLLNLEKPVIAAINGVAAGAGCNLALTADFIIASDQASFVQSFAKIGLVPDWGGLYLLPARIGLTKAKELMFSAERISAEEAQKIGLVSHVIPAADFSEFVDRFARKLMKGAPIPVALMKKILSVSQNAGLPAVLVLEEEAQMICRVTEDHREGLAAFKEKREARFIGK